MFEVCSLAFNFSKSWRTLPVLSWIRAARYHKKGLYNSAIPLYLKGIEKKPTHDAAFFARLDLVHCLAQVQRFAEAENHLRLLTIQHPEERAPYVRLVKVKMWQGLYHEAGLLALRAAQKQNPDIELISLALWCFVHANSGSVLIQEALQTERDLQIDQKRNNSLFQSSLAWYWYRSGDKKLGGSEVTRVALSSGMHSVESILAYAEILIDTGQVIIARENLNRALTLRPGYPETLGLLARCYLDPEIYNPDFASQLASEACRSAGWKSPKLLHLYAEALNRKGEYSTANLIARKAKHAALHQTNLYHDFNALEQLIVELDSRAI